MGFATSSSQPIPYYSVTSPLGFTPTQAQPVTVATQHTSQAQPIAPSAGSVGHTGLPGQATILPHAFNAIMLQDTTHGAWNMDTCDFLTRRVLLRCDSTEDLYPVTAPSPISHDFLVSQHMWHQRLGHPRDEMLHRLVSSNFISYNNEKPPVLCHACQLGKHVRLLFASSSAVISSCFDIIHSDVWTSPSSSLSALEALVTPWICARMDDAKVAE
ncbi:ribonuclease H-like domain-containing protein [Tanacetum coccineum]|uniref:Ribonuclease H-like domain-containing protein n=1 Tax=Tanacetum coccineum TaxID=301880 RepID=A0ABQ5HII0_9ASTR